MLKHTENNGNACWVHCITLSIHSGSSGCQSSEENAKVATICTISFFPIGVFPSLDHIKSSIMCSNSSATTSCQIHNRLQ